MILFHFCLSAAKNLCSFQLLPASLITDLLQLFFGLPVFLFPWGFQCRAAFVISPSSFLNVWPIHLNFLFFISKFISSCPVAFHRLGDVMLCQKCLHESCRLGRRIVVMKLICSLGHRECDCHTVHKFSQRRLTADWLAPRESDYSRMHSKASSDWLPSYIKATGPVLEIFKMAGYFPDSPLCVIFTNRHDSEGHL